MWEVWGENEGKDRPRKESQGPQWATGAAEYRTAGTLLKARFQKRGRAGQKWGTGRGTFLLRCFGWVLGANEQRRNRWNRPIDKLRLTGRDSASSIQRQFVSFLFSSTPSF